MNTGDIGLFSATTPLILAKKFTVANYVNFSHTYGQPIIHGKTVSESNADRKRLAGEIANAAQNKVLVTGLEDEIDIKTFTMSNSEKIYAIRVSLGSENTIAGWMITPTYMYKNSVCLNADGSLYNGDKWKLNNDGSGRIANCNISWDTAGNVTFSEVVALNWSKSGGLTDIVNALGANVIPSLRK